MSDNLALALSLPFDVLHIDLARAPEQLDDVLNQIDNHKKLFSWSY
ncbi:hypothetical protein CCAN11_2420003 [Capnocytophaga canimorsus]|uniref:Uncharacterized protein n=1 Tax=Capnocytophaga canimorsus TaxID=28188 RepID=A0A0B7IJY0_9FLAO|nr:hypothetical protein CCAN11_2420003 [Capnocytophaga canimorsus]